jgi:hypothetical protein
MNADLDRRSLKRQFSVVASRDVLWDIEQFQQALRSVLERAGHLGCTSGLQIDWREFEQWVINDKLEALPVATQGPVGFGG